jgi:DNA-binding MarR family transcriptional regulator
LRELGLHSGQELLLMRLLGRDGQTQSELLAAVGLDHSTLSKSHRRMQEAGLLTRDPDRHDRRVMRVSLTDKGRAMREPLEGMWSALERASVGDLDAETVERFIATSEAIRRAVVERGRPAPGDARRGAHPRAGADP